ncbi:uncharacterized protein METZ01_LOCUS157545, partial [marine metagenome]
VAVTSLQIERLRCLHGIDFHPDPNLNLITGANAAGKTSLLESIFLLSRGRSFRSGRNSEMIQYEASTLTVSAKINDDAVPHRLGIEIARGGRRLQLDGEAAAIGDLAALLPVQVIDPEVHLLIQGGPEQRRRFLDWGVFHVEPQFLDCWRRYRKALRQRNAALRRQEPREVVMAWDAELIREGQLVDAQRHTFTDQFHSRLSSIISEILPIDVKCLYLRGWKSDQSLPEALAGSWARDRVTQATQVGPHRANLRLESGGHTLRNHLSRGQQKLLAAALVIAQTHFVVEAKQRQVVLLVDDPAAELDCKHRERLFELFKTVPAQMFVAALDPNKLPWRKTGKRFHMEHGALAPLI